MSSPTDHLMQPSAGVSTVVCERPGVMRSVMRAPIACGPGEITLGIRRIGICGTDLHAFQGNQPYFSYPRVLGHELSGEVVAIGQGVDPDLLGASVAVLPYISCGHCRACQSHRRNCCQSLSVVGVHQDGGMAEQLVLPAEQVMVSSVLNFDQLALVECLAIGAHAVRRSAATTGELALVVGAGPIGLGIIQILRARGIDVAVMDTNANRLAFCRDVLGVSNTLTMGEEEPVEFVKRISDGALGDVVFDATGNPAAMEAGFDYAGHGAGYILVSIVKSTIQFSDPDFHRKELSLMGSRNASAEDFATVMALMAAGELHELSMITHRATLAAVPGNMETWGDPAAGAIKVMIDNP